MPSFEEIDKTIRNVPWQKLGDKTTETLETIPWKRVAIATAVGVTSVYVATPLFVSCLGFKATGIASSSIAAKMMSSAAIANGGGISATSSVAALQSAGVLGISAKSGLIIGGTTGGATYLSGGALKGTNIAKDEKDSSVNNDMNDDIISQSKGNEAKDIVSDSSSGTYTAIQSQLNKTGAFITEAAHTTSSAVKTVGNMTYDLMNKGGSSSNSDTQTKPAETKSVDDKSSYQSVINGASGIVTGATSYINKVAKMPSSLWGNEKVSDAKKEE